MGCLLFNPLSANPTKWSNTLKQLFDLVFLFYNVDQVFDLLWYSFEFKTYIHYLDCFNVLLIRIKLTLAANLRKQNYF